jgi:hypothetical protein
MKTRLPDLESIDQTAKATAAGLSQSAAAVAYELFRDREFRRMAGLEQLSQTEQDRIFNELVVGFLVLIMLLQTTRLFKPNRWIGLSYRPDSRQGDLPRRPSEIETDIPDLSQ